MLLVNDQMRVVTKFQTFLRPKLNKLHITVPVTPIMMVIHAKASMFANNILQAEQAVAKHYPCKRMQDIEHAMLLCLCENIEMIYKYGVIL